MRIRLPPQPKLRLVDLLRRRRMTLQDWFRENVVNTYDDLLAWCQLVGVSPPSTDEWTEMKPTPASKPKKQNDSKLLAKPKDGSSPSDSPAVSGLSDPK